MSRNRLPWYSLWQFRDFVMDRGIAIVIIGMLWGYVLIEPMRRTMGAAFAVGPLSPAWPLVITVTSSVVSLAVLIALNGIVSTDRKTGYYRFLFAKPVSAPRYYANAFMAHGIGMMLVGLVLLAAFSLFVRPMWAPSFVPVVGAMYLAYGGVGFVLSTIWRFDWLSLVTVAIVAAVGWNTWGDDPGIKGWLVHLLPPTHRAGELYAYVAGASTVFPWMTCAWLTGYGLVCFLGGLWILRVRSMAS